MIDLGGQPEATVEALPDANGMALTEDGRSLTGSAYSTVVSVHAEGSPTPSGVRDFGSSAVLLQPRGAVPVQRRQPGVGCHPQP